MRHHLARLGGVLLSTVMLAGPAVAHHSMAMFDQAVVMPMDGVVVQFDWTNPHSWIHADVTNEAGETERWIVELGDPRGLAADGWLPDTIVQGDEVHLWINPLRNGRPGGAFLGMRLAGGDIYGEAYDEAGEPIPAE